MYRLLAPSQRWSLFGISKPSTVSLAKSSHLHLNRRKNPGVHPPWSSGAHPNGPRPYDLDPACAARESGSYQSDPEARQDHSAPVSLLKRKNLQVGCFFDGVEWRWPRQQMDFVGTCRSACKIYCSRFFAHFSSLFSNTCRYLMHRIMHQRE